MWRVDGRVAFVSDASGGLGERFVRVLHVAGASVLATARRSERLDELASNHGDRVETFPVISPTHTTVACSSSGSNGSAGER